MFTLPPFVTVTVLAASLPAVFATTAFTEAIVDVHTAAFVTVTLLLASLAAVVMTAA